MSDILNPQHEYEDGPSERAQIDAELEQVDVERQARDWEIIHYFEFALNVLNAYQAHQQTAHEFKMSLRVMELALGFDSCAGADGPAELARKLGCDKQAVNKCLNNFNAQLKLSPLPGQRAWAARKNMSKARKNQLLK